MRIIRMIMLAMTVIIVSCISPETTDPAKPVLGQLKVGFDIDDTVLFSRENFLVAPHMSDDPDHVDYSWINEHDSLYSVTIPPMSDLIKFLRAQGHQVFFITARPGINGKFVARHLSNELGFPVILNENLFFSHKKIDPVSGNKYTSKHEVISKLGLHIFYGDSDTDMIAASIAGVRGVRVVRDARSVESYSKNYFGDTKAAHGPKSPFSMEDYQRFIAAGVGPFGETIYPIHFESIETGE